MLNINFLIFFILFLLTDYGIPYAASYQPGFRTFGSYDDESEMRLDINIWYPCKKKGNTLKFTPWNIYGALNAKCAEGKFPMLLISHPSPGNRFSYHDLAAFFASNGYIVVAPTHAHDCMDNMEDLFTWQQLTRRTEEIREAIRIALELPEVSENVDKNRICVAGFGSGGTAALLLGGAKPNCISWSAFCNKAGRNDAYCSQWAREKINNLCKSLPLTEGKADPQIKAIAVIAPAFGMLFDKESFEYFTPPVLLVGAGMDKFNKLELHCEPLARILGKRAQYLELLPADAGALMSACPPALEIDMPELCLSVTPEKRAELRKELEGALYTFFTNYFSRTAISKNEQTPEN